MTPTDAYEFWMKKMLQGLLMVSFLDQVGGRHHGEIFWRWPLRLMVCPGQEEACWR